VSTWRWWGAYAWEYWRFLRAPPLGEGTASAKIRKLQDTERLQKERGKSSKNLENQKILSSRVEVDEQTNVPRLYGDKGREGIEIAAPVLRRFLPLDTFFPINKLNLTGLVA
jgi:hypothetical protein